ncbi:MAG: 3-deoxy-D-manno-octulosonic acid transferase [Nitrospirota bacterium]|jgi:3-deoxy-D-manno-octulosonic-acid transferase
MYFLYNLLSMAVIVLTLPVWVWRYYTTPKYKEGLRQRLGHLPDTVVADLRDHPCFWVHAVSVGETMAALGLVEALHRAYPELRVVFSTVTATGQRVARERVTYASHVIYFPFDLPWMVRRVIASVRPRFVVVMETEIWPNFFRELGRHHVPLCLANGRLSPSSYRGYRRARPLMAHYLRPVRLFAMQSEGDGERMRAIGADAARVVVTGNLKYDAAAQPPDPASLAALDDRLGPAGDAPVWIAASTHEGEERTCLDVFQRLRQIVPELRLILVPRHPERTTGVEEVLRDGGIEWLRFSRASGVWETPVLLVDEVGWLMRLFGRARVAFVGGSLVATGGHNPLEPAAWGLPAVFGPHTFNFKDITAEFLEAGAGVQVADGEALYRETLALLQDAARSQAIGAAGKQLVEANSGALTRTVAAVRQAVGGAPA